MSLSADDKQKLYFIAFIPPTPLLDDALKLQHYFRDTFNAKAALNSPPHITLHMPFRWKEEKEPLLVSKLGALIKQFDPLKVCIDGFGSFPPRVVFMNVVKSEPMELMQKQIERFCKKEFNLFNANYREEPFHPHITLAFRDLKKSTYATAWEEFKSKEYKAEFMADKIALLKHDGSRWHVLKEFTLESSYSTENKKALETTEG